ncbi:hypothetical protein ACPTIV_29365 [Pseudomonas aeruginosa]
MFLGRGSTNQLSQGPLVEAVAAARAMLSVVAIGDGLDNQ